MVGELMCGICGKYNFNSKEKVDRTLILSMNARLYRRGPDAEVIWFWDNVGL